MGLWLAKKKSLELDLCTPIKDVNDSHQERHVIASIGQSVWSCKLFVHCLDFQLVISSLSRSDFILSGPHVFLLFPLITGDRKSVV